MVRLPLPPRFGSNLSNKGSTTPLYQSRSASPMRNQLNNSLILKVTVLKGRNLAPKDRNGLSDPYLVVNLGDARESTPTISRTLNPDWNVTFNLPVAGVPLLECICWDRDRIGRDYMGEFDIPLEEIFADGEIQQQPKWYTLMSRRKVGKKKGNVSGEILLQFSLSDTSNPQATPEDIYRKFRSRVSNGDDEDFDLNQLALNDSAEADKDEEEETTDETDDPTKPEVVEKRKRRLRIARLKRKSIAARAYKFTGAGSGVEGIVFVEICRIKDLPPERNVTRTSFDMDPFVVTSLGRKVMRTRVIRHNLNPVFDEKMVFQVFKHEQNYTIGFTVMDRDKLSGNDLVATAEFPLQTLIAVAPEADPETGLYRIQEPSVLERSPPATRSRFRLPLSRSSSAQSLPRVPKQGLRSRNSVASLSGQAQAQADLQPPTPSGVSDPGASLLSVPTLTSVPTQTSDETGVTTPSQLGPAPQEDHELKSYTIPLALKNKDRWEDKHFPELYVKAKYMPYQALRQQFWRVMLKQYDADDRGRLNKIELTTMLDTLGSTLKESTIDGFFARFPSEDQSCENTELTFDQAVICLEDTLQKLQKNNLGRISAKLQDLVPDSLETGIASGAETPNEDYLTLETSNSLSETYSETGGVPTIPQREIITTSEEDLRPDDLTDEREEEHVIEIRECPLCHQPRLSKRSDADIITHIATCASSDWRQVDNLVMGGFVTSSQAQRKWYSKVMTKISYGGYRLGANSANILVQDRITGQINEEKMSVYVRLGIRLLYKGLKSREMEKKRIRKMLRSLSIKQGKKYDDPASAAQIESFINFHRLNMNEVKLPVEQFKTFNEFFYRELKPDARPCSAPNNPKIVVSPADCRSVVFDRIEDAMKIWVKGREFSIERLFGKAYPEDAKRYKNGALGIFRLAPQDYHRFHVAVDGVLGTPKTIEGEYYTVNPMAIRSALDVYGENVRVLVPIDSVAHGRVMVVCVGAMMVGSTVITRQAGERVSRAEELGYFKFGGSTLLLLFEPGVMNFDNDLIENSKGALETLIRVGMAIGHTPDEPQFAPDMPKKQENITQEEKREANRRIAGNLGPPRTGTE